MENSIEKYLSGTMNSEELKEFEARLGSDAIFAEEYAITLAAHKLIKEAGRIDLKETLESFDQEMQSEDATPVIPIWMKKALLIAAILIVLFGVYQFIKPQNSFTGTEVYNTYFEAYSKPSSIRDSENSKQINWEKAASFYSNKEFEKAILFFNKTGAEVPDYLSSFYTGISLLSKETPNYQEAIEHFELVINSDNDYIQQALWYKGLALLKLDKKEEAMKIFNAIVDTKGFNYLRAEQIINLTIED